MSDSKGADRMTIEYLRERVRDLPPSTGTDTALMIVDAFARLQTRCEETEGQVATLTAENERLRAALHAFVGDGVRFEYEICDCGTMGWGHTPACRVARARAALGDTPRESR